MVTRLRITLEQDEYKALLQLASDELRNPADQMRTILRQELTDRGLLQTEATASASDAKLDQDEKRGS